MTKTHAELSNISPCAVCLGNKIQVDRLERDDNFFVTCVPCGVFTPLCASREEAISYWDYIYKQRVNKEAEFLEELKQFLEGYCAGEPINQSDAANLYLAGIALEKIKQFQAEQKVDDERS